MKNNMRKDRFRKLLNGKNTIIMGIVNVTPDSFSDGGKFIDVGDALEHALKLVHDGADIIDIGGESSRPGSDPIKAEEEIRRVIPVIKEIRKKSNVLMSIDTYKPEVAREALNCGVDIINDITGFTNDSMINVARKYNVPVIVMHMKGTPKTMQTNPHYKDVLTEIYNFFKDRIKKLRKHGVKDIVIDPGIGFGKSFEDNITILKNLNKFSELNCPILIGNSRKSFLGLITHLDINEREEATIASNIFSVMNGAKIIRVHDVEKNKRAFMVFDKLNSY